LPNTQAAFGDLVLENGEGGGSAVRRPGRPNAVKKFVKLGLPALIKDSKVRLHTGAEASGQCVCVVGCFRSTAVKKFVKLGLPALIKDSKVGCSLSGL
jgi:hypothetical protein